MSNTLKLGNGKWATGKDTILAYNDLNSNYKPLAFSFSRASSGTVVNKDGLIETVGSGEPRIDFKDNTKGALKLEPTRTNEWFYSEDFSNSNWIKTNVTISENSIISPDGTLSASKIIDNSTSGEHRVRGNTVYIPSGANFSIFVKAGEYNKFAIANLSDLYLIKFDLSNGTIISTGTGWSDAKIENYGNGWYRLSGNISINKTCGYGLLNDDGDFVFSGTGNKGVYIWGAQFEPNSSYPTSYIPTSGSAVTRVLDVCNNGGNKQVINSTEGVLYVEIKRPINQLETSQYLGVSDGSTGDRFIIGASANSSNLRFIGDMNDVRVLDVTRAGFNKEDWLKIAIVWDLSEFKIFINGTKNYETTLSDNFTPNRLNTFEFANGSKSSVFYGISKDVKIYNTALTDQELIALTTI